MEVFSSPSEDALLALLRDVDLPTSDIEGENHVVFFGCGSSDDLAGIVGLEIHGRVGLLRSLAVRPNRRGEGIAQMLVEHLEQYAQNHAVSTIYLLTTTAELFFPRLGYTNSPREKAPQAIQRTTEFSELCPSNSTFMVKHLNPHSKEK